MYNVFMDDNVIQIEDRHLVLNEQGKVIERDITIPSGEVIHVVAGDNQHILENGATYDDVSKRIAVGPPKGGTNGLTTENRDERRSEYYQQRTAEIMRQAIASRDKLESGTAIVKSWEGGVLAIGERLAESAMKDSRDGNDAAKLVFTVAQLVPDRRSSNNVDPNSVELKIGGEVAAQIIAIIAEKQRNNE